MAEHNSSSSHEIAVSFSDASIWCYSCDSYIDSVELSQVRRVVGQVKFAQVDADHSSSHTTLPPIEEADMEEEDEAVEEDVGQLNVRGSSIQDLTKINIDTDVRMDGNGDDDEDDDDDGDIDFEDIFAISNLNAPSFSYIQLLDGLRKQEYRRVVFLTGAGISVAAGIPDFRTPGEEAAVLIQ